LILRSRVDGEVRSFAAAYPKSGAASAASVSLTDRGLWCITIAGPPCSYSLARSRTRVRGLIHRAVSSDGTADSYVVIVPLSHGVLPIERVLIGSYAAIEISNPKAIHLGAVAAEP
jgi:hypothetical protein